MQLLHESQGSAPYLKAEMSLMLLLVAILTGKFPAGSGPEY